MTDKFCPSYQGVKRSNFQPEQQPNSRRRTRFLRPIATPSTLLAVLLCQRSDPMDHVELTRRSRGAGRSADEHEEGRR